jgi:hypothetical protein
MLLPAISAALEGAENRRVDEIVPGWFSRWFIRTYIAANPGGTRARAPEKVKPAERVAPDVLDGFLRSIEAARALVRQVSNCDVKQIRYRNPFIPLLRFTVGTGFEIIAKHAGRHLFQAEAVTQSAAFPH